jgi:hypothetical protein
MAHPGTRTTKEHFMATTESNAPRAHPSSDDHDDTVEAHCACLERPHACEGSIVYIGHLVIGEDGAEVEVIEAAPCRRCAEEASL